MRAMKNISVLLLLVSCTTAPRLPLYQLAPEQLEVAKWGRVPGCCTAAGPQFAVATGGTHSAEAAMEIFAQGGNFIDAAVAAAFSLSVERPHSAGLGGGGFATVHWAGKKDGLFLDFRETAPQKATHDFFLRPDGKKRVDRSSQEGIFSVATPGFVAGMWDLHQRGGKLPWAQVLQPAMHLAANGFIIYPHLAERLKKYSDLLRKDEGARGVFFDGKRVLGLGDRLVQRDLANTLSLVAQLGPDVFYKGAVADKIVSTVQKYGGVLSAKDLIDYKAVEREPLVATAGSRKILSAPPPSAGGILLVEMMKVWAGLTSSQKPQSMPGYFHLLAEVFKRGFAERSQAIGDPAFVKVPVEALTSDAFADKVREALDPHKAVPSSQIRPGLPPPESHGTTGLAIMDSDGNAIALSMTINARVGSGIVASGTGILLNNEMDDFSVVAGQKNLFGLTGDKVNAIAPGKRPASSMAPTIILESGVPVLALTAVGGSRIVSGIAQTTLNYLDVYPGDLRKALFAPRMHHQWLPDKLEVEEVVSSADRSELKSKGHAVVTMEHDQIVLAVGKEKEQLRAVHDPRTEGGAQAQ